MNVKDKKQMVENISTYLICKINQGYLIKMQDYKIDYNKKILYELTKLEKLSIKYIEELKILSKDIRKFLWYNCDSYLLYITLFILNEMYKSLFEEIQSVSLILDYIIDMSIIIKNNASIFEKMKDDIYLTNAKVIISRKWKNVLLSDDGGKSFIDLFDDIFINAVEKYKDLFFVELTENDVLCRMVKEKDCIEDRFIPLPNKAYNRWNPPGKTYLYLSYEKNDYSYNKDLTLAEYICLLECRTQLGEDCCFARFKPAKAGKIFDLSYNDVTLEDYRNQLSEYENEIEYNISMKLINNTEFMNNLKGIKKKQAKKLIHDKVKYIYKTENLTKKVVSVNLAKQILKMICQSIFTKVDEESNEGKEKAYQSFHLLSEYLENKGISGIIYPCTRTNKIIGKNIVLFNIKDAIPIKGSIKKYHYSIT